MLLAAAPASAVRGISGLIVRVGRNADITSKCQRSSAGVSRS